MLKKSGRLFMAAALAASLFALPAHAISFPTEVSYPVEDGEPIYKTYDLEGAEQIGAISRADITYRGTEYRYFDTTVETRRSTETRDYKETVTNETDTNNAEKILASLEQEKPITTEDGFSGVATLDPTTLVVTPETYGTSSRTRTLTRVYPSMLDMDVAYLPQTVAEGGITYALVNCSWSIATNPNPYDVDRGTSYTATATYSAKTSSKYAKTYSYSVDYTGTLEKASPSSYHCVAIYAPVGAATVETETTQGTSPSAADHSGVARSVAAVIVVLALMGLTAFVCFRLGKRAIRTGATLGLAIVLAAAALGGGAPAYALSYSVDGAALPNTVPSTSVSDYTLSPADVATDAGKNAAFAPPGFGTAEAYIPNRSEPLIDLRGTDGGHTTTAVGSGDINAINPAVRVVNGFPVVDDAPVSVAVNAAVGYTPLSAADYYADGRIGQISIPAIGVNFGIYEGTDAKTMNKGAGHFTNTTIWDGNVCLAAHNRGVANNFGKIQNLQTGDLITLETARGIRTYSVYRVSKIEETDLSILNPSAENMITLTSCVANERAYRYVVQAKMVE